MKKTRQNSVSTFHIRSIQSVSWKQVRESETSHWELVSVACLRAKGTVRLRHMWFAPFHSHTQRPKRKAAHQWEPRLGGGCSHAAAGEKRFLTGRTWIEGEEREAERREEDPPLSEGRGYFSGAASSASVHTVVLSDTLSFTLFSFCSAPRSSKHTSLTLLFVWFSLTLLCLLSADFPHSSPTLLRLPPQQQSPSTLCGYMGSIY